MKRHEVLSGERLTVAAKETPSPNSKVKVRKRKSHLTFFLVVAAFLALTAFRSTKCQSPSQGKAHKEGRGSQTSQESDPAEPTGYNEGSKGKETRLSTAIPGEESRETRHPHHSTEFPSKHSTRAPKIKNESVGDMDNATTIWGDRCIKPAIEQFPPTVMGPGLRQHGGFIVHIALAAYTFLALAIICDEFFVPSLEKMCDVLKMQPDVAGATFMAAGSSAPELATALIGVFVAKDDIGVSGVIGSAVFNIMFVISICGLTTKTVLYLNWWPMVRDCFFYMVSILALLVCIYDEEIEWYESIVLLLLYGVYIYAMYMNTVLEAWAHTLPIPFPVHDPAVVHANEKSGLVTYKAVPDGSTANPPEDPYSMTPAAYGESQQSSLDYSTVGDGTNVEGLGGAKKVQPPETSILEQFNKPTDSVFKQVLWRISLPLVYLFYYTVPDCRIEQWKSWYVVTFTMAMIWIALFSYVMVWMITVVGFTLGVPDTVMGLTFVAAGVSVPDALSSLAVMKEGFGDMAVSNAVGSNVFDILICLGLPWFLSTVVINPGDPVKVISKGLTYSTLSLLSTVAFLLLATHYNGWKLNKTYGVLLMLWYLLFMILASLYELNVFGDFNPPECPSTY